MPEADPKVDSNGPPARLTRGSTALLREPAKIAAGPTPGAVTRADLTEAVHREIGVSRAESAELVETVLNHICERLIAGDNVKISSFGSFVLRDKAERIGRNPKTGVEVPIEPRRVLTFRPSQLLRDRINTAK